MRRINASLGLHGKLTQDVKCRCCYVRRPNRLGKLCTPCQRGETDAAQRMFDRLRFWIGERASTGIWHLYPCGSTIPILGVGPWSNVEDARRALDAANACIPAQGRTPGYRLAERATDAKTQTPKTDAIR
jgi:hypothetical protein